MDALVTTDWLARAGDAVRIVDATWFLPPDPRRGADEFAVAHIPGAVFFDLDAVSDRTSPLPHMLPPPADFAAAVGALGIARGDAVVVYDNSPVHSAARVWWMFRLMGVARVALLDGRVEKWRSEGRPVASGVVTPPARSFVAEADLSRVRDLAAMRATTDQIVDTRSAARFAGHEPEPRAGLASGHMPGALNLPASRMFEGDGTWKPLDALRAAFDDAGIDLGRPITASCGSGVSAATIVFALHRLGRDAALYDGSWAEWGGRADTPKAVG